VGKEGNADKVKREMPNTKIKTGQIKRKRYSRKK
jgi:hypothetical protein